MPDILNVDAWRQVVVQTLTELMTAIAGFLPNLVAAAVILGVGWVISKLVELIAERALHRFGLDRAAERLRVADVLAQGGLSGRLSSLVARLLFWVVMLTFLLSAVETLGLTAATATIDRLISYLPNVIAAALILLVGLLLGRLARNVVASAAAAAALPQAMRLGAGANGLVVMVVVVLTLGQLGVDTNLLVTVITAVVATLGLTMGVAFALGAREVVGHILAGHYLRQTLAAGRVVEVHGRSGVVERVGPVATLFRLEDRTWSVPNARLLEEFVIR